jgi:hypothetical protein
MELSKFKKEMDIFDEHHIHNMLHEYYDDENYYVLGHDGLLQIEDHTEHKVNSLIMRENFIISEDIIEIIKFLPGDFRIETYKTLTSPIWTLDSYIVGNLLYLTYMRNIYIIDMETGNSWKVSLQLLDLEFIFNLITHKDLLILTTTVGCYIINKDGSYNKINDASGKIRILDDNIYFLNRNLGCIITVNLINFKSKRNNINCENIKDFYITPNNTILIYYNRVEVFGSKRFTIDPHNFASPVLKEGFYIHELELNKHKSKLLLLMTYDYENNILVMCDLNTGEIQQLKFIPKSTTRKIGFLDISQNQDLKNMGSKLDIDFESATEIPTRLLKTIEI